MRQRFSWMLACLLLPLLASADGEVDSLRARMMAAFDRVPDYRVEMTVAIDMPGMKVSGKRIRLDFMQPDSFRYKAKGFALLPKRSVSFSPRSLFEGLADTRLLAPLDSLPGVTRLAGSYREGGETAEAEFWVDEERLVPLHFSLSLRGEPVLMMDTEYTQVNGEAWLPRRSEMRMKLDTELQDFYEKLKMPMRRRKQLQEGLGRIDIVYGDYELRDPDR